MRRKSHPDCDVCNGRHAYHKGLRAHWKAAALCPNCGGPRRKYKTCAECRRKDSAVKREEHARKKARLAREAA